MARDDDIPIESERRVDGRGPTENTPVDRVVGVEARCRRSGWIQAAAIAGVEAVAGHDDLVRGKVHERIAVGMTPAEVPEIDFLSTQKDRHLIVIGHRRRTG